jgi:hypothetical protein
MQCSTVAIVRPVNARSGFMNSLVTATCFVLQSQIKLVNPEQRQQARGPSENSACGPMGRQAHVKGWQTLEKSERLSDSPRKVSAPLPPRQPAATEPDHTSRTVPLGTFQPIPGFAAVHARHPSSDQTVQQPPKQPSMEALQQTEPEAVASDGACTFQQPNVAASEIESSAGHTTDDVGLENQADTAGAKLDLEDAAADEPASQRGDKAAATGELASAALSGEHDVPAGFAQAPESALGTAANDDDGDALTSIDSDVANEFAHMDLAAATADLEREMAAHSALHEISTSQKVAEWNAGGAATDAGSVSPPLGQQEPSPLAAPSSYRSTGANRQLVCQLIFALQCHAAMPCMLEAHGSRVVRAANFVLEVTHRVS